jgi:transcriptional regulator of acetoin/glycerol metabolism
MSIPASAHARAVHSTVMQAKAARAPLSVIERSWTRCLEDYHLDPARNLPVECVDSGQLRERLDAQGSLLDVAKHEMANLYRQLAGDQLAVLLTDHEGVILHVVGDPAFTRSPVGSALREGSIWSEERQGTNGMGTALAEGAAVVVHRNEHFFAANTQLSCTASPIFDSAGRLVAALDVSSQSELPQQHSIALVRMAAQMVENRDFLNRFAAAITLRFHSRGEFVYTLGEGMLAFSPEGRLLAANQSALVQLGGHELGELLGRRFDDLFSGTLDDIVSRSLANTLHPVPVFGVLQGTPRFFAVAQAPAEAARHYLRRSVDEAEDRAPGSLPRAGREAEDDLVARSGFGDPVVAEQLARARRVLDRDVPILICGETGSGKEVFARALHRASTRAEGPFVAVNCAALPESLVESELFGYKSGAFTGAGREGRRGKIVQASGGTLFLDEIGDMPIGLQAKLLRVLEDREVYALGAETPVRVDIQIMSATHCDLGRMVEEGRFRKDLYYRLLGLTVILPPLRERRDRPALVRRVLAEEAGGDMPQIEEEALAALAAYHWPGNLRQLRRVLRVVCALAAGGRVRRSHLPPEVLAFGPTPSCADKRDEGQPLNAIESAERDALLEALSRLRWNVSRLAVELGVSRNALYRKMKRLRIPERAAPGT